MRGDGGFGGEPGPRNDNAVPDRVPDGVVESYLLPQLALLYRLSGDKNPLHADPEFAKRGGFDRPIVHGLCSYGVVCRAITDKVLDGDVDRVRGYGVRFAGVGYPGETYSISYWRGSGKVFLEARSKERDEQVLSNAFLHFD
jgi:acyl dehydratase